MNDNEFLNLAINYIFQGFVLGIVFSYAVYSIVGYAKERKGNKS